MTQQPDQGGDLSYDEAHDAHVPQASPPARAQADRAGVSADPRAELSGDYSYDLAHDVPPG